MKWMIMYSRKRNEKSMAQRLASEIVAASKGEGSAHKKKEDTHRMAEANKAFAKYRFQLHIENMNAATQPLQTLFERSSATVE